MAGPASTGAGARTCRARTFAPDTRSLAAGRSGATSKRPVSASKATAFTRPASSGTTAVRMVRGEHRVNGCGITAAFGSPPLAQGAHGPPDPSARSSSTAHLRSRREHACVHSRTGSLVGSPPLERRWAGRAAGVPVRARVLSARAEVSRPPPTRRNAHERRERVQRNPRGPEPLARPRRPDVPAPRGLHHPRGRRHAGRSHQGQRDLHTDHYQQAKRRDGLPAPQRIDHQPAQAPSRGGNPSVTATRPGDTRCIPTSS